METKKSKYDTNPLDPDFVKNAEEACGARGEAVGRPETQEVKGATREIGSSANENARGNVYSEAPTRRYDNRRSIRLIRRFLFRQLIRSPHLINHHPHHIGR